MRRRHASYLLHRRIAPRPMLCLGRLVVLFALLIGAGCSIKYDYSIVHRSPAFSLGSVEDSRTLVVLSDDEVDLSAVMATIGDPNAFEAQLLHRLRECMTGQFRHYRSWQGEMRAWMRAHIVYVDSGRSGADFRDCIELDRGRHGAAIVRLRDSARLSQLLAEHSCAYVIFLEDLVAGSTTGVVAVPDISAPMLGVVPLGAELVTLEYPVMRAQFFLFASGSDELLYQGYVLGNNTTKTGSMYEDHVLSFTGQLVRGVLDVR